MAGRGWWRGRWRRRRTTSRRGSYEHCVEQFKGGLRVGNVVERLVYAHDHQLEALEEAASSFIQVNALSFQVSFAAFCFESIQFFWQLHAYII